MILNQSIFSSELKNANQLNYIKILSCLLLLLTFSAQATFISPVFINELHYDNNGADQNEFVELAGVAGTNLENWSLIFYRGSNGTIYKSYNVGAVQLTDQINGFGTTSINISGIYNGSPNGIALVNPFDELVQFISYEGSFTGTEGVANGITSENIGVSESGSTLLNYSLQLSGTGNNYHDFTWQPAQVNSKGSVNNDQVFSVVSNQPLVDIAVPEPNTIALFAMVLLMLLSKRVTALGV